MIFNQVRGLVPKSIPYSYKRNYNREKVRSFSYILCVISSIILTRHNQNWAFNLFPNRHFVVSLAANVHTVKIQSHKLNYLSHNYVQCDLFVARYPRIQKNPCIYSLNKTEHPIKKKKLAILYNTIHCTGIVATQLDTFCSYSIARCYDYVHVLSTFETKGFAIWWRVDGVQKSQR